MFFFTLPPIQHTTTAFKPCEFGVGARLVQVWRWGNVSGELHSSSAAAFSRSGRLRCPRWRASCSCNAVGSCCARCHVARPRVATSCRSCVVAVAVVVRRWHFLILVDLSTLSVACCDGMTCMVFNGSHWRSTALLKGPASFLSDCVAAACGAPLIRA